MIVDLCQCNKKFEIKRSSSAGCANTMQAYVRFSISCGLFQNHHNISNKGFGYSIDKSSCSCWPRCQITCYISNWTVHRRGQFAPDQILMEQTRLTLHDQHKGRVWCNWFQCALRCWMLTRWRQLSWRCLHLQSVGQHIFYRWILLLDQREARFSIH